LARALDVPVHLDSDPVSLSARIVAASGAHQSAEDVAHALAELSHAGVVITDFALGQPSLDEVFLALTGHTTTDQADDPSMAMKEKAS
jgi:ABC-2 type transport system ATP-binding protein